MNVVKLSFVLDITYTEDEVTRAVQVHWNNTDKTCSIDGKVYPIDLQNISRVIGLLKNRNERKFPRTNQQEYTRRESRY